MNNLEFLQTNMANAGIELNIDQVQALLQYKDILLHYNKQINLTAITDEKEIALKHFVDSCMGIKAIKNGCKIADVGTGAGLPGIPLAIALPRYQVTLVDSLQKRTNFLNHVKDKLQLNNIEIINARSEDFGHQMGFREGFDIVVSRGVAPLHKLSELCLPLVSVGGTFIAYKGGSTAGQEADTAQNAISAIGGQIKDIVYYQLPSTDITHSLIIVSKISQTPTIYPRKPNKIKNNPIL